MRRARLGRLPHSLVDGADREIHPDLPSMRQLLEDVYVTQYE